MFQFLAGSCLTHFNIAFMPHGPVSLRGALAWNRTTITSFGGRYSIH